jgi:hypothetical protein
MTSYTAWKAKISPVDQTSKERKIRKYSKPKNEDVHRNAAEIRSVCKVRLKCGLSCRNCEYYKTKYCTHKAGE